MFETTFDFFVKTLQELGFSKGSIIRLTRQYLDKWSNNEYDPYNGKEIGL